MAVEKVKKWYAVYTKSRAEKKTAAELELAGIEVYLPLQKTIRRWSDRRKKILIPLIRSYLFVKITEKDYYNVIQANGVVSIVKFSGKPAPIPEWQIQNLKILLGSGKSFKVSIKDFHEGDLVTIKTGVLCGLKGIVNKIRGRNKLFLTLDALELSISVTIHPSLVEPVKTTQN
ncbi:MAG: UpxY family transcription antiterminator [Bacteroidales bacterium]|nr:UpxY family transcription antiterminator [Bacteroidales bacterium]